MLPDFGDLAGVSLGESMRSKDESTRSYDNSIAESHLKVLGMTCATCVGIVEGLLREIDGVVTAKVNLMASRAAVRFMPTLVTERSIVDAVNRGGYKAEVLELQDGLSLYLR